MAGGIVPSRMAEWPSAIQRRLCYLLRRFTLSKAAKVSIWTLAVVAIVSLGVNGLLWYVSSQQARAATETLAVQVQQYEFQLGVAESYLAGHPERQPEPVELFIASQRALVTGLDMGRMTLDTRRGSEWSAMGVALTSMGSEVERAAHELRDKGMLSAGCEARVAEALAVVTAIRDALPEAVAGRSPSVEFDDSAFSAAAADAQEYREQAEARNLARSSDNPGCDPEVN